MVSAGRGGPPTDVEEHSGGQRGLVHLAHAGEEVVRDFHDGCHYLAAAIALQAVVALTRPGSRTQASGGGTDEFNASRAPAGAPLQYRVRLRPRACLR